MPGAPGTVNLQTSKALALTAISTSATGARAPPRGMAESIGWQCTHLVVAGEHLWVIHSIDKEDIGVGRNTLSELHSP